MNNLIYHYQSVIHNVKDNIYLHEAFSTRQGQLYMVNPVPTEVFAESEEEMEIALKVMEADRSRYKPIHISSIIRQMELWTDEVDTDYEFVEPLYEDEEDLSLDDDYVDNSGEVIDLVDYINRNK